MKTLETDRLVLRPLEASDAEGLFCIQSKGQTMRYLGGTSVSAEEIRRLIALNAPEAGGTGFGMRAAVLRSSGELIGRCGLFKSVVDGVPEIEIAYLIVNDLSGNGFATECALALVRHAINDLGLNRIVALIDSENAASLKVAKKAGFRYERERIEVGEFGQASVYTRSLP